MQRTRQRNLLGLVALAAALLSVLGSPARAAGPRWVDVEPNAVARPDQRLRVTVAGVPVGERVLLQILQDCDHDGKPEERDRGACRSPLDRWESQPADARGRVADAIDLAVLDARPGGIPREVTLTLRASSRAAAGSVAPFADTIFGVVENPCTLWQTAVQAFWGGRCDPGLAQALRQHLGPAGLEDVTFEVRRMALSGGAAAAVPVAGTRGATGVAWLDDRTLAVTLAAGGAGTRAGLLRVPLDQGTAEMLWSATDDRFPTAPLALPGGRIALIRQRLAKEGDGPRAWLSVWRSGRIEQEIALPEKIHQLVAVDQAGRSVLALALNDVRPAFFQIDLGAGTVTSLGFAPSLYHAALREPGGERAVVALEDNSGTTGWDLVLVGRSGQPERDLAVRKEHDLLPAWRPAGGEIAYLAQVPASAP